MVQIEVLDLAVNSLNRFFVAATGSIVAACADYSSRFQILF